MSHEPLSAEAEREEVEALRSILADATGVVIEGRTDDFIVLSQTQMGTDLLIAVCDDWLAARASRPEPKDATPEPCGFCGRSREACESWRSGVWPCCGLCDHAKRADGAQEWTITEPAASRPEPKDATPEDDWPPLHLDAVLPHRTFSLRVKADHDWLADYFSGYHGVPGLRAALAAAQDTPDPLREAAKDATPECVCDPFTRTALCGCSCHAPAAPEGLRETCDVCGTPLVWTPGDEPGRGEWVATPKDTPDPLRALDPDALFFDLPIGDNIHYSRGYSAAIAACKDALRDAIEGRSHE